MNTKLTLALAILIAVLPIATSAATLLATTGVGVRVALTDYDPSPAQPGKYLTLYLKAENTGGDVADNPVFKLDLAYPFSLKPGETETRTFTSIGSHEQVLLEYGLYVDKGALQGEYELNLKLCTNADCSSYAKTPVKITVKTGGLPKIEVGVESSDIFYGGKRGTITMHILNRGMLDTKFLVAELQASDMYDIISPPRVYIGELKSDDYETIEYDIYVKKSVGAVQSEKVVMPFTLDYSDSNDKEYSETQNVIMTVYSPADLKEIGLVPGGSGSMVFIAIAVIAAFGAFMLYKKFRKKKPSHGA
ncbi:MAG: hypothetical protein V1839_01825 [archaeon]